VLSELIGVGKGCARCDYYKNSNQQGVNPAD